MNAPARMLADIPFHDPLAPQLLAGLAAPLPLRLLLFAIPVNLFTIISRCPNSPLVCAGQPNTPATKQEQPLTCGSVSTPNGCTAHVAASVASKSRQGAAEIEKISIPAIPPSFVSSRDSPITLVKAKRNRAVGRQLPGPGHLPPEWALGGRGNPSMLQEILKCNR